MKRCLVFLPHSYTGRGPAESCVRIVEHFAHEGLEATVHFNRVKVSIPDTFAAVEALPGVARGLPYRVAGPLARPLIARKFAGAIRDAEPGSIAYFWPDTPVELVELAKARGLICVREMINSPLAWAKPILDDAYRAAGLAPAHGLTDARVLQENHELTLYDYIFSSNDEVDAALRTGGIPEERILKSSFGWSKARFPAEKALAPPPAREGFRAVFVGLMNVRKGIATLLEAWDMAGVEGKLALAGAIEGCLDPIVQRSLESGNVVHLGHVSDVAALYRSSDIFVFPTHEEGGPQVTYEAAACGIPVITTSMGAARLVEDGETGVIVPAGDPQALAAAIAGMARDPDLRSRLAQGALSRVEQFEYEAVGRARAKQLLSLSTD